MPHIIPIRDLKNTSEISQKCHDSGEPLFITKNGYGDMVIMSIETYERLQDKNDIYQKIALGEQAIQEGKVLTAEASVQKLRDRYGI